MSTLSMRSGSTRVITAVLGVLLPVAVALGIWELTAQAGLLGPRWPSLADVAAAVPRIGWGGVVSMAITFREAIFAVFMGIVVGVPVGVVIGLMFKQLSGLYLLLTGMRAVPVTILIPVALVLFGIRGFLLPLIGLAVSLLVATDLAQSVRLANHQRYRLMRLWGMSRRTYVRHVLLYEILGSVLSNLRIVLPMALALHVALDYFLSTGGGIGRAVERLYSTNQLPDMYAHILAFGAVSVCFVLAVDIIAGRALAWQQET